MQTLKLSVKGQITTFEVERKETKNLTDCETMILQHDIGR